MPATGEKCICCHCGETLSISEFYSSISRFYANKHLPICKKCFAEMFFQYRQEYHSDKKAMQRVCMAFDVYFDEDVFDKCGDDESKIIGKYFRKMNIVQYRDKTFDNTIENGAILSGDRRQTVKKRVAVIDQYGNEQEGEKIDQRDIDKWGIGFDPVDYSILNSHYKLLKDANPNCDSNQEIFINDLCYIKMQQMKAVRSGAVDDYSKMTEQYRKSFQQAGLKTVRDANINEDFTFGVNAETIEKYTPAEFYKGKELYRDFDNIGGYIERFLLRPLRNLMHGTSDRDYEYFVKDESDEDVFEDEE